MVPANQEEITIQQVCQSSQLHNVYLPTFKAAVEEGAATAMASFNDLNGVPCTVNEYTLRQVLKDGYGLDGFVVSDANGIKECVAHGIAEDEKDAGSSGCQCRPGYGYGNKHLLQESGTA